VQEHHARARNRGYSIQRENPVRSGERSIPLAEIAVSCLQQGPDTPVRNLLEVSLWKQGAR